MSGTVLRGVRLIGGETTDIAVAGGRIVSTTSGEGPAEAREIDTTGLIAAPGFIDLQVNGAAGMDITSDPDAMWSIGEALARHGVTAFLATVVSSPRGCVEAAIEVWQHSRAVRGAVPIGLHVEGPFLSPARAGAHRPEHVRPPDPVEAAGWNPESGVRIVTLAPELAGATELVAALTARGVIVSAGHTDADAAGGRRAVEAGIRFATHLPNAMRPLDHRVASLAAALLVDERVTIGVIADGVHVAPEMLSVIRRGAGPGRLCLVSDAMAGLGLPPGSVRLGEAEVEIGPDAARLADGTLAGAIAGLDVGLRTLVASGCDLAGAIATVTSTPARLLGLDDGRGALVVGGRADIALLTPELEVAATLVAGEVAWAAEPARWA